MNNARGADSALKTILILGFWDLPAVLTFSERCRQENIAVNLVRITARGDLAHRKITYFGPVVDVITWEQIQTPNASKLVRALVDRMGADAITSADEGMLEWLAAHRDAFEPKCKVLAANVTSYRALETKEKQLDIAKHCGFDILESWYFRNPNDSSSGPPESQYPLCVRPSNPNAVEPTFKAKILISPAELRTFLDSRTSMTLPLIGQTYQLGPTLIIHGARAVDGRLLALKGFVAYRRYQGISLSLKRADIDPELAACCQRFVESVDFVGVFHFDILWSHSSGRYYFLEMNPRLGGTTAKVAQLGYDECGLLLESFGLGVRHSPSSMPTASRASSKRMLIRHAIAGIKNRVGELGYPVDRRWREIARSIFEFVTIPDPMFSWRRPLFSLWYMFSKG